MKHNATTTSIVIGNTSSCSCSPTATSTTSTTSTTTTSTTPLLMNDWRKVWFLTSCFMVGITWFNLVLGGGSAILLLGDHTSSSTSTSSSSSSSSGGVKNTVARQQDVVVVVDNTQLPDDETVTKSTLLRRKSVEKRTIATIASSNNDTTTTIDDNNNDSVDNDKDNDDNNNDNTYNDDDDDDDDDDADGVDENDDDDDEGISLLSDNVGGGSSIDDSSSSSLMNHDNNNNDDHYRGYFVFHVGPAKTASTTIQWTIHETNDILHNEDRYAYIGKRSKLSKGDKLRQHLEYDNQCRLDVTKYVQQQNQEEDDNDSSSILPECWNDLLEGLDELTSYDNILMSSESLNIPYFSTTSEWWNMFSNTLEQRYKYKLVIVVVYRRLYQWWPSAHNQHSKHQVGGLWPMDGGPVMRTIHKHIQRSPYYTQKPATFPFFWTSSYIDNIPTTTTRNIETRILNMHDHDDNDNGGQTSSLETKFFCNMIPNAPASCNYWFNKQQQQLLQEERHLSTTVEEGDQHEVEAEPEPEAEAEEEAEASTSSSSQKNPSQPLFYDYLNIVAGYQDMIDVDTYTRDDMNAAVQFYQEQVLNRTEHDFPLVCPTDDEHESILQSSIDWEHRIIHNSHNNNDNSNANISSHYDDDVDERHKDEFEKYVLENKYCFIDAETTLQMNEWIEFYNQYNNNNSKQKTTPTTPIAK